MAAPSGLFTAIFPTTQLTSALLEPKNIVASSKSRDIAQFQALLQQAEALLTQLETNMILALNLNKYMLKSDPIKSFVTWENLDLNPDFIKVDSITRDKLVSLLLLHLQALHNIFHLRNGGWAIFSIRRKFTEFDGPYWIVWKRTVDLGLIAPDTLRIPFQPIEIRRGGTTVVDARPNPSAKE